MAAGVPSAIGAKRAVNPRSKHLLRITSEEAQYEGARGTRLELGRRKPDAPKKIGTTIGNFIDAVREKTAILPKTIESYALALRKIAADIAGLSGGSRDAWDVKLSRLTPEAIEAWRIGFIRRKAVNPLAEKSAKVSASSFILRARSVFSAETVAPTSPDYIPF